MSENAGYLVVVESSTDAAAYTQLAGGVDLSIERDRNMIDVTAFLDLHKLKMAGVKDGKCQISGNLFFASGTLQVHTSQKNIMQRARDGGLLALRTKLNGTGGTYVTLASALVTEFSLSAEAGGAVKFSATLQNNGAGWV